MGASFSYSYYNSEDAAAVAKKEDLKATKFRMIQLHGNDKKRKMHYTFMILIWVGAFLLIIVLIFICKFIPSWFPCMLFIGLVLLVAMGATVYLYMDLVKRDPMDYDRLHLGPPDIVFPPQKVSDTDYAAFTLGFCTSANCCSRGTTWDSVNSKCIANGILIDSSNNDVEPNAFQMFASDLSNNFASLSEQMTRDFSNYLS